MHMGIALENIRSTFNVGSAFRTANACASEVFLVGYTPSPIDRMGRVNTKLQKTALYAEQSVSWSQYGSIKDLLQKQHTYTPVLVEQTEKAVSYEDLTVENPLFIFGNEVDGASQEARDLVKHHIFLPMHGSKSSLNVATCIGIVLYHHLSTQNLHI